MGNTIITRLAFNYGAKKFTSDSLKKGTKVIVPDGVVADVLQNGKRLLRVDQPKTFKISKKTVPGLTTKLFKKDIDKIEIYCYGKNLGTIDYRFFKRSVSDENNTATNHKSWLGGACFSMKFRFTFTLADADRFTNLKLNVEQDGNVLKRYYLTRLIPGWFDAWAVKNVDYLYDNHSCDEHGEIILWKKSEASEKVHELEKELENKFLTQTGYQAKVECLGILD